MHKNSLKLGLCATVLINGFLLPFKSVSAHERFVLPSHTILSGKKNQSVTLISSISNAIHHPDRPFGDNGKGVDPGALQGLFDSLQPIVITPNGKVTQQASWQAFARMSVADVALSQAGTYRVGFVQPSVNMTTFTKPNGAPWRVFGENPEIPEGSSNIVRRTTSSRVETFISFNQPNTKAVNPTGNGLELSGQTHPNDLFVAEAAKFQLYFDGKPLTQSADIKLVRAGTRHRNQLEAKDFKTDENGHFDTTFDQAGFYLLSANLAVKGDGSKIDIHHYGLYLTLEVFPQ